MRVPGDGFDRTGTGVRIVVVAVFYIGFGEDTRAAELTRASRAVPRSEHHRRGQQRGGATPGGISANVRDHQHNGWMSGSVERPVGNGEWLLRRAFFNSGTVRRPGYA